MKIIDLLKKNKCLCLKSDEPITLKKCKLFQCKQWKKCMTKTNNKINKELKK